MASSKNSYTKQSVNISRSNKQVEKWWWKKLSKLYHQKNIFTLAILTAESLVNLTPTY